MPGRRPRRSPGPRLSAMPTSSLANRISAPGHIQGVFPRLQHTGQPVDWRRPGRCCAWICAGRRSGCNALRRFCRTAETFLAKYTVPRVSGVTSDAIPFGRSPLSTTISSVLRAVRASPLANVAIMSSISSSILDLLAAETLVVASRRGASSCRQVFGLQVPAAQRPCSGRAEPS